MNNVLARGVIEFIAVILGITVSFWCDGLSEDSQNENERVKVLTSLKMEIGEIKNYCDERKRTWNNIPAGKSDRTCESGTGRSPQSSQARSYLPC